MEKYYLWEGDAPGFDKNIGQDNPSLTPFLLNGKDNPCIIVCPGGAYVGKAAHEGAPVAEKMNSFGISAFTLDYRVRPYHYPEISGDLLRAVRYVRHNAEKFGVDRNKIGVLGFSAGGHLVMTSLRLFDRGIDTLDPNDPVDKESSRPDFGVLCYAVTTLRRPLTHGVTRSALLGDKVESEELVELLSGESFVPDNMPPTFVWHTAQDQAVPIAQVYGLCERMQEKKIPYELHVFPYGLHGLGLSENQPHSSRWPDMLQNWLKLNGFLAE